MMVYDKSFAALVSRGKLRVQIASRVNCSAGGKGPWLNSMNCKQYWDESVRVIDNLQRDDLGYLFVFPDCSFFSFRRHSDIWKLDVVEGMIIMVAGYNERRFVAKFGVSIETSPHDQLSN